MADKNLQVRNHKYYVVFQHKGKTKWVNTYIEAKKGNKTAAKAKRDEILTYYRKPEANKDDKLLTDYLEEWLVDMKNILKSSTWETYDKTIHGKLIPYFAPKELYLRELTPKVFTEYFKYLKRTAAMMAEDWVPRVSRTFAAFSLSRWRTLVSTSSLTAILSPTADFPLSRRISNKRFPPTHLSKSDNCLITQGNPRATSTFSSFWCFLRAQDAGNCSP